MSKWIKLANDSGFGCFLGNTSIIFTYSRKVGRDWVVGKKFVLPLELARRVLKEEFFEEVR